jgi:hypothetical protein
MRRLAAVLATVLLAGIALFQLALVFGAPWGRLTQGGAVDGALPASGRLLAAFSMLVLAALWVILTGRAGLGPGRRLPKRLLAIGAWVAVAYAVLACLLNAATPSSGERALWLPVSVLLLACAVVIAWPTRRRA